MSTLKEKFDDYTVQPDEKVWTSIQDTLRSRAAAARRRRIAVATTTVVASAVVIALVFGRKTASLDAAAPVMQQSVQTASAIVPEVTADENITTSSPLPVKESSSQSTMSPVEQQSVVTASESAELPVSDIVDTPVPVAPTATTNNTAESRVSTASTKVSNGEPEMAATVSPIVENEPPAATQPQQKTMRPAPKSPTQELAIWIPNAFSPDDPENDVVRTFKVLPNNGSNILSFEMYIYSRTGRQIYHSRDINQGWDGTANGQRQPMGTYVYIIELYDAVKGLQQQKGTVTLVR